MRNVSVFPQRSVVRDFNLGLSKDSTEYHLLLEAINAEILSVQMGLGSGCEFRISQGCGRDFINLNFGIAEVEEVAFDYSSRTLVGHCFYLGQHTFRAWEEDGDRGHDYLPMCDSLLVWSLKAELARLSKSVFGDDSRVFSSDSLFLADNCSYWSVVALVMPDDASYDYMFHRGDDAIVSNCAEGGVSICGGAK